MKEVHPADLRELTIEFFKAEESKNTKDIVRLFSNYIKAYCAEMKKSEWDILLDDELYESVYSIFHSIVFAKNLYGLKNIS